MEHEFPGGKFLKLKVGDITREPADAIVNAANAALAGGGGVDGAIHRAGGPSIMRELDQIRAKTGGCPTGSAVVTAAGLLPARFIFHAVGPVYRGGKHDEPELLASCYQTCLQLAEKQGVITIAFPSISTGAYRFPLQRAARIAVSEIEQFLQANAGFEKVVVVCFGQDVYTCYQEIIAERDTDAGR